MIRIQKTFLLLLSAVFIISLSFTAFAGEFSDADNSTILDNSYCNVSIGNFKYNNDFYAFSAEISFNNKTDLNLYFSVDCISVNGYMCEAGVGTTVNAMSEATVELTFDREDFERNFIKEVQEMEFMVSAANNDDWSSEWIFEELCTVYPFGKDYTPQPEQKFDDDAIVLVDNDDCSMIITGFERDTYFFIADIYLENKTDIEVEFKIAGASSVNGYCISPYFYKDVMAGKKMNTTVQWYLSDFSYYGIISVTDLALDIVVSDANDWFADYVYECSSFLHIQ